MKKKAYFYMFAALCFLATFSAVYGLTHRTNQFIVENGKKNMSVVMEQLKQNYDNQLETYFANMRLIEDAIITDDSRNINLDETNDFILRREENKGRTFLFMKGDGCAITSKKASVRLDVPNELLINLDNKVNVANLVSGTVKGEYIEGYLIAISCETYFIDGEAYTAFGALYDRMSVDSLLDTRAYGGDAYLFLLNDAGTVTYTNQNGENFLRNYSLLKHLKKDEALNDDDYLVISDKLKNNSHGVELLGKSSKKYYFGYVSLETINGELVCIVAKSIVDNTLVSFQNTVVFVLISIGLLIVLFTTLLLFSMLKIKFDYDKQLLQEQSLHELELEKKKALDANRSKSEFLSNMSHDIRTPMNAIVGLVKLMQHDIDNHEKMIEHIHQMDASSSYLLGLINDILDMSKIEAGEVKLNKEVISLDVEIKKIYELMRGEALKRNQEFNIRVDNISHEYLLGDSVRLRQILLNLISNAIKYTPDGGVIDFSIKELGFNAGISNIEVTVSDTGCGMTHEFLEYIFEPFIRAENSITNKIHGTGLGMSITKKIVDTLGGTIVVESEPGVGSTFVVTIPFPVDLNHNYSLPVNCVLLYTKDNELKNNVSLILENSNVKLITIDKLALANKLIEENKPDVLIIGEYTNIDAVRFLKKMVGNAIVLACDYSDNIKNITLDSSFNGYLTRPFFFESFSKEIKKIKKLYVEEKRDEFSLSGMKFLCAEDNDVNATILSGLLEIKGATSVIYQNGKELVEAFKNVKEGDFDAILMDMQMPVMDGLEATRKIRASENPLGSNILIIAMTANAFSSDVSKCIDAGMNAHIPKPLDISALEAILKDQLGKN